MIQNRTRHMFPFIRKGFGIEGSYFSQEVEEELECRVLRK